MAIKNISDYNSINSINSVNPLYFIVGEVDGYIDKKNGNKYLTIASKVKKQRSI